MSAETSSRCARHQVDPEHVSWCDGTHNKYGECIREVEIRAPSRDDAGLTIRMVGVPADTLYIEVGDDAGIYKPDELEATIAALAGLQAAFVSSRAELDKVLDG